MKDYFGLYLKGMAMGAADVVPGVSGGTVALIVGVYERLLQSINKIDIRRLFSTIDFEFFLPLGAGIGTSLFVFAGVIHSALTFFPGQTYAFFLGLIVVSAWLVWQGIERKDAQAIMALILGVIAAYVFVGLNPIEGSHSLPIVFGSGFIAIIAMMLPGISGSFLLLLLGQYEYVLGAVRSLNIGVLVVFSVGCLAGVFAFSRILEYLMTQYRAVTLSFLVGMMVGSLRLPYQEILNSQISLWNVVVYVLVGSAVVWSIEKMGRNVGEAVKKI